MELLSTKIRNQGILVEKVSTKVVHTFLGHIIHSSFRVLVPQRGN